MRKEQHGVCSSATCSSVAAQRAEERIVRQKEWQRRQHRGRRRAAQGSSIDMYNNDGGKKFMKQTGALKCATLYFAS